MDFETEFYTWLHDTAKEVELDFNRGEYKARMILLYQGGDIKNRESFQIADAVVKDLLESSGERLMDAVNAIDAYKEKQCKKSNSPNC